jgi:hypothetical protein
MTGSGALRMGSMRKVQSIALNQTQPFTFAGANAAA